MALNCPHCATATPEEARLCASCGEVRKEAADPESGATPVPPRTATRVDPPLPGPASVPWPPVGPPADDRSTPVQQRADDLPEGPVGREGTTADGGRSGTSAADMAAAVTQSRIDPPAAPPRPEPPYRPESPYRPPPVHAPTAAGRPAEPAAAHPATVGPGFVFPVGPAPAPATRPRRPLAVWAGTLLGAVVVGGGITAGVLFLEDRDSGGGAGAQSVASAPASSPAGPAPAPGPAQGDTPTAEDGSPRSDPSPPRPAPEVPAAPSDVPGESDDVAPPPDTGAAPAGFRQADDPEGFALLVPEVWHRIGNRQGQVTYGGSTGMEHLLVGVVRNPDYASSYENFRNLEQVTRKRQSGYQRIRLERNTFQGRPGAVWEYTYLRKGSGERIRAIDQGYIAANGTDYSLYTTARERDWPRAQEIFGHATASWRLTE
ncbi:hypothetical protein [Streptomyces candidus]|uniref:Serine/threonine protein kinase n=1 Tax=Streptomyces candidus TaxID=67283 RepID=A0A7X0LND3_9ACTN|nr:hypothetical protein [Streptomyces candidus]MBB6434820.1 hypothetical protein [Streptomyces candidus]GHH41771.1 hypothetical protein GCM10018773_25510 [Streptomyces candidus]